MSTISVDPVLSPSGPPPWSTATRRRGSWRAVGTSLFLHGCLALLCILVAVAVRAPRIDLPPQRLVIMAAPPNQPRDPTPAPTSAPAVAVTIADPDPTATTPIVVDTTPQPNANDPLDSTQAAGDQGLTDERDGSIDIVMAIGGGGGDAGRQGIGAGTRGFGAGGHHGSPLANEVPIGRALRWFRRHQSPDGHWDVLHYQDNCTALPRCEPGSLAHDGGSDADVAVTGYALLCYLARGYGPEQANVFRRTVATGLDWLLAAQQADGSFGHRTYEHAVATMALAEACQVSSDPRLTIALDRAVAVLIARQAQARVAGTGAASRLGRDYLASDPGRNDASVSGWAIMALRAALPCHLLHKDGIVQALLGARTYVQRAWQAANPGVAPACGLGSGADSSFPYTWNALQDRVMGPTIGGDEHDLAAVGAVCSAFLGAGAGDPRFASLCQHVMRYDLPAAYPCNTYLLYYATLAMFQAGGEAWQRYDRQVSTLLIQAQRSGADCYDGSWDYAGTRFPGADTGRLLSTAFCCLSLEVYYRHDLLNGARDP